METVQNGKLVAVHFTLKDDTGKLLETTREYLPALYIHGQQQFPAGFEMALEGKSTGDIVNSEIEPEQGFGLRNEGLLQTLPLHFFDGDVNTLEVGMQINADTGAGNIPVRIIAIEKNTVTVDGNHAFAGKHLRFNAEVRNVRNATEKELRGI